MHFIALLIGLCVCSYEDNYGVVFNDSEYTRIISTPADLISYTIPYKTKVIAGSTASNGYEYSAFKNCKSVLTDLNFQEGSLLEEIEQYGFYGLEKVTKINLSVCLKLKTISSYSFAYCRSIESLILPPLLTSIGPSSMTYISSLRSIIIPATVVRVYQSSFYGCSALSNVTWESGSIASSIDSSSFRFCNLSTFHIPKYLQSIGVEALTDNPLREFTCEQDSVYLTTEGSIIYDKGKTKVCFAGKKTSGTIRLPNTVSSTSEGAFMATEIDTVVLTSLFTSIANYVFMYSKIKSITIPSSVSSIGLRVFMSCNSLNNVTFEGTIDRLPTEMLRICLGLKQFRVPNQTKTLGSMLLYECSNIETIFVPKSVTSIESGVFGLINKTAIIEFENDSPLNYENDILYNSDYTSIVSYIGSETSFELQVKDSVKVISDSAFINFGLSSINFGPESNLTSIGSYSLKGTLIRSIDLPPKLEYIYEGAFNRCSKLESITMNQNLIFIGRLAFKSTIIYQLSIVASLTTISEYAFEGLSTLKTIIIDSKSCLKTIGKRAFAGTGIEIFRIPSSLQNIDSEIFAESNLAELYFLGPSNISKVPDFGFRNSQKLKTITFCDGIESIGQEAFKDCTSLQKLDLVGSITEIGISSFAGCSSLTSVAIPDNSLLSTIEREAFYGCTSLDSFELSLDNPSFFTENCALYNKNATELIMYLPAARQNIFSLPSSVLRIRQYGFQDAINLEVFKTFNCLQTIEYGAFSGCVSLRLITIPNTVTKIGNNIFSRCPNIRCGSIIYPKEKLSLLINANVPKEALSVCTTKNFTYIENLNITHSTFAFFLIHTEENVD